MKVAHVRLDDLVNASSTDGMIGFASASARYFEADIRPLHQ